MSKPEIVIVDTEAWVEKARDRPPEHIERRATEVLLAAIGLIPKLKDTVILKGGTLMGLCYQSPRQTADLDFTIELEPTEETVSELRNALDEAFPKAAVKVGSPDIVMRVQRLKKRPKPATFEEAATPALDMSVAYAERGSPQQKNVEAGKGSKVLRLDISFREPVVGLQVLRLGDDGPEISAYSLIDIIAEKFRALLQQEVRNRSRRQDVYDIALLSEKFELTEDEKRALLDAFIQKCAARQIRPTRASIHSEELQSRAKEDWDTLTVEVSDVPPFDHCYAIVVELYESMPWPADA